MMDLRTAARILGGQVSGRNRILSPGPGHSRHDRSLAITFDPAMPDGFMVHSFAGDDWQEAKDHVRNQLGLDGRREQRHAPVAAIPRTEDADEAERIQVALAIWDEAGAITRTPAEAYLASRGLSYEGDALRWHSSCPFGSGERLGCMIGLVRNIVTNKPQAIHRTAIDANGQKIGRKALGPLRGGCVKLTDDAEVERVIAVGEGIESSLSIRRLPDLENMPVWAAISAAGLSAFPALPGVETAWIIADNDLNGTGQRAAWATAQRLRECGIEVLIISPSWEGEDLNDFIAQEARRAQLPC